MSLQALSAQAPDSSVSNLLVLLHGWGANAQDVAGIAPYMPLVNYQMLFPNAPHPHQVAGGMVAPDGRMWYALPADFDFDKPFTEQADLQHSRQLLIDWLTTLPEQTGIPLEKTVLGGFSQGGAMVLDVGPQLPVAGMMILSGYSHGPISVCVTPRPIVIVHGRQDPVVPVKRAQLAKAKLEELSMVVDYHEFNMGHEISMEVLKVAQGFCEDRV